MVRLAGVGHEVPAPASVLLQLNFLFCVWSFSRISNKHWVWILSKYAFNLFCRQPWDVCGLRPWICYHIQTSKYSMLCFVEILNIDRYLLTLKNTLVESPKKWLCSIHFSSHFWADLCPNTSFSITLKHSSPIKRQHQELMKANIIIWMFPTREPPSSMLIYFFIF